MSATEMLVPAERGVAAAFTADGMRQALAQRFHDAGLESPNADARILVGHALGLDHTALAAARDYPLSVKEGDAIAALGRRRLAREPVARIVGSKEFWSLPLLINSSTLVPRPETETVVEVALAAIGANDPRTQALSIADLGTGSGALLLALLSELPNAHGIATDISIEALLVARVNAHRLGIARAAFVACDVASPLLSSFD